MITLDIKLAIKSVRIVLDDIAKEFDDDFAVDTDIEIEEALKRAAREIIDAAPMEYMVPKYIGGYNPDPTPTPMKNSDGTGYVVLPPDFRRLVRFKLYSWSRAVTELLDPTSDEAKMQASRWTWGTPNKPKVMLDHDMTGYLILRYWTAGMYSAPTAEKPNAVADHRIEYLYYLPDLTLSEEEGTTEEEGATKEGTAKVATVSIPLREGMGVEDKIIYRAAGLFLIGKKEAAHAENYFKLSEF